MRLIALGLCMFLAFSCSSTKKNPGVNIQTIDNITRQSTKKLLATIRQQDSAESLWVAYVGVDNQSSVDLGTDKFEIDNIITETLVNSNEFRNISEHQVKAARRAAGIDHVEDLTLAKPREKFLAQLTDAGRVPDYLMFGSLTTATSDDDYKRRFRLTLQMMNSSTGEIRAQDSGTFTRGD